MNEIVFMCAIALCVVFLIRAKFGDKPEKVLGFSLVEMLMALLVASLLLAALAPVMTKKFGESVNVNGIGNYERQGYGRLFNNDDTWKVPAGVNTVKITAVGGGGAGGSTTYAYKKPLSPWLWKSAGRE